MQNPFTQSILKDWFSTKYHLENAIRVINNDTFKSKMSETKNSIQCLEDIVEESLKKVEQKTKKIGIRIKRVKNIRGDEEVQYLNNKYARKS